MDGVLLDAIHDPHLALSEYVSKHVDDLQPDSALAYDFFGHLVSVDTAG